MKYFIIFLFSGFVMLIATMVVLSMRQTDIHLVSKDYYKEELAYQTTIDAIGRTKKEWVSMQGTGSYATVLLHPGVEQTLTNGTKVRIHFQRPDDAKLDRDTILTFYELETWDCEVRKLRPGRWQVRVSWQHGANTHMWQAPLYL